MSAGPTETISIPQDFYARLIEFAATKKLNPHNEAGRLLRDALAKLMPDVVDQIRDGVVDACRRGYPHHQLVLYVTHEGRADIRKALAERGLPGFKELRTFDGIPVQINGGLDEPWAVMARQPR